MSEEEATIVIDNGSFDIKAGFSSEEAPCSLLRSAVERNVPLLERRHLIEKGIITNWDDMEKLWNEVFHELHADPAEHPVLLSEVWNNPKENRERTMEVMFETFSVESFFLAEQAALSLMSTGKMTGIVCDFGSDAVRIVPVNDSPIPDAATQLDIGGEHLNRFLQRMLDEIGGHVFKASEKGLLRDIKEKHGYVALDFDDEMDRAATSPDCDVVYTLPDGNALVVGNQRFRCPELLFQPSLNGYDFPGVVQQLFDSIMKCADDIRENMVANVTLCGGTSMFNGLPERVEREIFMLAPPTRKVKIIAPLERKYAAWIGGSILASLDTFPDMCVTRGEYNEDGTAIVHRKCVVKKSGR